MSNEKLIEKIKNLIELAHDNPSDKEGQTALLLAQKLMLKNNIELADVDAFTEPKKFETSQTVGKEASRILWWERYLSSILASNFRCVSVSQRDPISNKSRIIFFGEKQDAELVSKIFEAALLYLRYRIKRLPVREPFYKNSYIEGFLAALEERFKKQVEEYSLMVLPSKQTREALKEVFPNLVKKDIKTPEYTSDIDTYQQGRFEGKNAKIMPDEILEEDA